MVVPRKVPYFLRPILSSALALSCFLLFSWHSLVDLVLVGFVSSRVPQENSFNFVVVYLHVCFLDNCFHDLTWITRFRATSMYPR